MTHDSLPSYLGELYARIGGTMKFGLDRTRKFMEKLGHPESKFKSLHIAGTNGKGSVTAILARILQKHGYRTGRFTSPHLLRFNERIRIDDGMIPEAEIRSRLEDWQEYIDSEGISFFEITTGLAFSWFADQSVDIAVVETGLGGRLDSTNVLDPELSLITHIARDHMKILGSTLPKIAAEKAGIIKAHRPVITGQQSPGALNVLKQVAEEKSAPFIHCNWKRISHPDVGPTGSTFRLAPYDHTFHLGLAGRHQLDNMLIAVTAAEQFLGSTLDPGRMAEALETIRWKGRFEILSEKPRIIYDVAHNLDGAQRLFEAMDEFYPGKKPIICLGLLEDKQFDPILRLCRRHSDAVHLCHVHSHRAFSMEELMQRSGLSASHLHSSCSSALNSLIPGLSDNDLLLIFGSHYIASEVYAAFPEADA